MHADSLPSEPPGKAPLSEWPSLKNPQTINTGEGVERSEPAYAVGVMQMGTDTMENVMEIPENVKNRAII